MSGESLLLWRGRGRGDVDSEGAAQACGRAGSSRAGMPRGRHAGTDPEPRAAEGRLMPAHLGSAGGITPPWRRAWRAPRRARGEAARSPARASLASVGLGLSSPPRGTPPSNPSISSRNSLFSALTFSRFRNVHLNFSIYFYFRYFLVSCLVKLSLFSFSTCKIWSLLEEGKLYILD